MIFNITRNYTEGSSIKKIKKRQTDIPLILNITQNFKAGLATRGHGKNTQIIAFSADKTRFRVSRN